MRLSKLCVLGCSLALGAGLLGFLLPACGKQGEGQRCDVANGNDDCEDGLVCTKKKDLGTLSDICCPPAGVPASDLACAGGLKTDAGAGGSGGSGGAAGGHGGSGGAAGHGGSGGAAGHGGSGGAAGGHGGAGGAAGHGGVGGVGGAGG